MATNPKSTDHEWLKSKIYQLEEEFRWCAMHPNDVSKVGMEQLKQAIDELYNHILKVGGKFLEHFNHFKSQFEYALENFESIKPSQFQQFEDLIQVIIKDL
ncbi:MAG: hypothetical protein K1060chlam5_00877 [Candidatus Anoxychlamydiales bacterium]|nr:hypothetical protein [Candidatus Anoxychlamydiales bacterium]